jgi:hypothetical protein
MKLLPTFRVSVKVWPYSDVHIRAPFSIQRTIRVYVWGPSETLVRIQGSFFLDSKDIKIIRLGAI